MKSIFFSYKELKVDADILDDKRLVINIVVVIYSVYISVLWSIFIGRSFILTETQYKVINVRSEILGFTNLFLLLDFYFWTSFIMIAAFALSFALLVMLSVPSRRFREDAVKLNSRRWKLFLLNFIIIAWLFMLPCAFLEPEYGKISFLTFLNSFVIIFCLAAQVLERISLLKKD